MIPHSKGGNIDNKKAFCLRKDSMKSKEIRQRFISFFTDRGHTHVPSSSLIPAQDPTLLFANAGMNQFKDVFLGLEKRSYTRAVSIQKCVRAGGKHSDLDNVGFTKRHLTFFEMMGNFSFGDYFKKEAITFAWEFLTKSLHLPSNNLHASVFTTDDESYDIWHKQIGLPKEKIHRLGEKDNFWQMGDLGPCGPCTEIYIDRGSDFGCKDDTQCGPGCDCDRFLEIWNLVFMQFDRQADGTLKPLKHKGVDTGMGLERLCSIAQNKDSVFETDLFTGIIERIEELTEHDYAKQNAQMKAAFHVIADHIRSSSFIIADGCAPSNEGRGYVLRKIIRRAALFAQKLTQENIFPELSRTVVQEMGDIYPELIANQELIYKILDSEIKKFSANLTRGYPILQSFFEESKNTKTITGEQAFKLYDTFGFPLELVTAMAREKGYRVDLEEFEKEMSKQQEQSGKKTADPLDHISFPDSLQTEFTGYQELETTSEINALVMANELTNFVPAGQTCWVITKKSPFFIVGGGQVPDQGWLTVKQFKVSIIQVRYLNGRIGALIKAPTDLQIGDTVTEQVDKVLRINAMKNHTATHLLQAALIAVLGKQVKQSGSLVHPDYLRFDFTYPENLTTEQIKKVEDLVNEKIRENIPVKIEYTSLKNATNRGVLAFFGEKYNPEQVRIVDIPGFSAELCGGTHVHMTGDIGTFKITDITALSAGHRRIVAATGPKAIELFQETFNTVKALSQEFKVKREEVLEQVLKQKDHVKELQSQLKHIKSELWHAQIPTWEKQVATINNVPFLFLSFTDMGADEMRDIATTLGQKKPGFYFLFNIIDDKSLFLVTVAPEFAQKINLKDLSSWLAENFGLRGGGAKNMLQGGGVFIDTAKLSEALKKWLQMHG